MRCCLEVQAHIEWGFAVAHRKPLAHSQHVSQPSYSQQKLQKSVSWRPWQRQVLRIRAASSEEPDIAVFRFTLGIPGFDDSEIPRVLGWAALVLLTANHIFNQSPVDGSQVRAEGLGAVLAGLAIAVPSVNRRLEDAQPGRGRRDTTAAARSSKQAFYLRNYLAEEQKQELAWASFALLKNANIDGILAISGDSILLARGEFSETAQLSDASALQVQQNDRLLNTDSGVRYIADNPPVKESALKAYLPPGTQTLLVIPLGGLKTGQGSFLVLWSKVPRALSQRDIKWAVAIGDKLKSVL